MIQLTRINQRPLIVNSDLIEHIEATPDTMLSMTNGQKLVVLETVDEVVRKVIDFRRSLLTLTGPSQASKINPQTIAEVPASARANGIAPAA